RPWPPQSLSRHAPADDDAVVPGWVDSKRALGHREELLRDGCRRRRARILKAIIAVRGILRVWIDLQRNIPAQIGQRLSEIELQIRPRIWNAQAGSYRVLQCH